MNPLARLQAQQDQRKLSIIADTIESHLRKAGDLAERIPGNKQGYLFLSNLDQGNLTRYMVGTPALLRSMLVEAGQARPELAAIILEAARELS